jgi:hypothetical protein
MPAEQKTKTADVLYYKNVAWPRVTLQNDDEFMMEILSDKSSMILFID